jgi:hypothetical protein
VSDLIGEISSSSIEQSSGIGQIGMAVNQLNQAEQRNAALVEESAAAESEPEAPGRPSGADGGRVQARGLILSVCGGRVAPGQSGA